MNKKEEYVNYIREHIGNVTLVWLNIQEFLTGVYWLDEGSYISIREAIIVQFLKCFAIGQRCLINLMILLVIFIIKIKVI